MLEHNYKRLWGLECEYSGEICVYDYNDIEYIKNSVEKYSEVDGTDYYVDMFAELVDSSEYDRIYCVGLSDAEYNKILKMTDNYKKSNREDVVEGIVLNDSRLTSGEAYKLSDTYDGLNLYVSARVKDNYDLFSELNKIFMDSKDEYLYNGNYTEYFIYNLDSSSTHINKLYFSEENNNYNSTGGNDYTTYYYHFAVKLNPKKSHVGFNNFIKTSQYEYYSYTEDYDSARDMMTVVRAIATVVIIILLIMYMVNIINIKSAEMIKRKNELNTLRAIGMSIRQQSRMLYAESVITAIISAVLGSIIGVISSRYIVNVMLEVWGEIHFTVKWSVIIFTAVLLIAINIFNVWMSKPDDSEIQVGEYY